MKKKIFVPLCLLIAVVSCSKSVLEETTTTPITNEYTTMDVVLSPGDTVYLPYGTTYMQRFADDFSTNGFLDPKYWAAVSETKQTNHSTNLRTWFHSTDMVSVNNGKLVLSSKKISDTSMKCGAVSSSGKYDNTYGFWVAKMKIQDPNTIGSQSSFWLNYYDPRPSSSDVTGGTDGAELDVFESSWLQDTMQSTSHIDWFSNPYNHTSHGIGGPWIATNARTSYHQYGLHWLASKLVIYYDGNAKIIFTDTYYIPQCKEYMKVGTGAAWGSAKYGFNTAAINATGTTYVDWVRHYN